MNIFLFVFIAGIFGLIIGEIAFLILKYFMMKEHHHYEMALKNLTRSLKEGKVSQPLYKQMCHDLEEQYHVARYDKLGNFGRGIKK